MRLLAFCPLTCIDTSFPVPSSQIIQQGGIIFITLVVLKLLSWCETNNVENKALDVLKTEYGCVHQVQSEFFHFDASLPFSGLVRVILGSTTDEILDVVIFPQLVPHLPEEISSDQILLQRINGCHIQYTVHIAVNNTLLQSIQVLVQSNASPRCRRQGYLDVGVQWCPDVFFHCLSEGNLHNLFSDDSDHRDLDQWILVESLKITKNWSTDAIRDSR